MAISAIFTVALPAPSSSLAQQDTGEDDEILVGDRPLVRFPHRGVFRPRHLTGEALGVDLIVAFAGERDLDADTAQQPLESGGQRRRTALAHRSRDGGESPIIGADVPRQGSEHGQADGAAVMYRP